MEKVYRGKHGAAAGSYSAIILSLIAVLVKPE